MRPPLEGIRVLDFGWIWSGPLVATTLAEFGAEVIKVEHRGRLDNMRLRGHPVKEGKRVEGPTEELNPYFNQINHNKASITVNLKDRRGVALLHRLVAISDVVTENLTPGALSRNELGFEALSRINPRLVMLSMASAGQTGPMNSFRAYAPIMSSYCGLESVVGYPGEPPIGMMNFGYGDPNAAVHALLPLLGALYEREETGKGQYIDMSQIEALVSVMPEPILEWQMSGTVPQPQGNRNPAMAPHGVFPCRGDDRWITLAVPDDDAWRGLLSLPELPPLLHKARYCSAQARLDGAESIERELANWTKEQDRDELAVRLHAVGIAAAPVLSMEERLATETYDHAGLSQTVRHPYLGDQRLFATPWVMDKTPPRITSAAPLLGDDNERVFNGLLGLSKAEIVELEEAGVIA